MAIHLPPGRQAGRVPGDHMRPRGSPEVSLEWAYAPLPQEATVNPWSSEAVIILTAAAAAAKLLQSKTGGGRGGDAGENTCKY